MVTAAIMTITGWWGMTNDVARAWVEGWVLSRGVDQPIPEVWGLRIEVGAPNQVRRHVLLDADDATVRALATSVNEPLTWIKAFIEPEELAALMTPGWEPDDAGWLMATDLAEADPKVPAGYHVEATTTEAGVTHVRILAADGAPAARGQIAVTGDSCVFDQIVTEPQHQRRGLGTVVMTTLTAAAHDQGAATGILGATIQGRALYESLGWHVVSPLSGFIYRPAV